MSASVTRPTALTPSHARDKRHALRRGLWELTSLSRVSKCGRQAVELVEDGVSSVTLSRHVATDPSTGERIMGQGVLSGLQTCGSVHACPVCAAGIREGYADEVEQAAAAWLASGGGLEFVTLTVRHAAYTDAVSGDRVFHSLAELWDAVQGAWNATNTGRSSQLSRELYGIAGTVRAAEVTWGSRNGWHPHLHLLVFTEAPLSAEERQAWIYGQAAYETEGGTTRMVRPDGLWRRWRGGVAKSYDGEGDIRPELPYGIDVQPVTSHRDVAHYLAKVQDPSERWQLGREVARLDTKLGGATGRTPFELLAAATGHDDSLWVVQARAAWAEWERTSRGRKVLSWSRGLRDRVALLDGGGDLLELVEDLELLWTFSTADRSVAVWHSGELLSAAEHEGGALEVSRVVLDAYGISPPDPEGCLRCAVGNRLCPEHHNEVWRSGRTHRELGAEPLPSGGSGDVQGGTDVAPAGTVGAHRGDVVGLQAV